MEKYDSARIICELANTVIELRIAQFVARGSSEDLARLFASKEVADYLARMDFSKIPPADPMPTGTISMRVRGGARI